MDVTGFLDGEETPLPGANAEQVRRVAELG
jgi:hypothetical protein